MNKNLQDTEYFDKYCESAKFVYESGGREVVFIKDNTSKFCYLSAGYVDGFLEGLNSDGLGSSNSLEDHQDKISTYFRSQTASFEAAIEQDEEVKSLRKEKFFIYVDRFDQIGLIRKSPIINPFTNNVVGIIGYIIPFILPNISQLLYRVNNINHPIVNKRLNYEMTTKQHMVLFLAVHNFSYTEISKVMTKIGYSISPGRVNEHLESLKFIFRVKSKEELIRKGLALSYHLYIPRGFLKSGSYLCEDIVKISDY